MKKLSLLLIVVMVFCSACSNNDAPPTVSDDVKPPSVQTDPLPKTLAPTSLLPEDARAIAQAWLDEHPDIQFTGGMPNIFKHEYHDTVIDGEDYYLFFLDNPEAYWFSVLVHTETGSLLHRFMPDGEFPIEEIEPLDEWYNRYYGE